MNGKNKLNMKICPFQTQITNFIPPTGQKPLIGSSIGPQVIKVACDQEKCPLWISAASVCAVSVIMSRLTQTAQAIEQLEMAIRDIHDDLIAK